MMSVRAATPLPQRLLLLACLLATAWSASIAGVPLTPSEVDAVIARAQAQLGSTVTAEQIAELRRSLGTTPAEVFSAAAHTAGKSQPLVGDVVAAASAASPAAEGLVWGVVEKGLLVGATAGTGNTTVDTPSSNTTTQLTEEDAVLGAPATCPSYGCVCSGKPDSTLVAAPQNCRLFVVCSGGTGSGRMCASGFGFDPKAATCKPLSAPATNGTKECVFASGDPFYLAANAGAASADAAIAASAATVRPASAPPALATKTVGITCDGAAEGVTVRLTNIKAVTGDAAATGGSRRCELVDPTKSGTMVFTVPAGWGVSQLITSSFTIGTGGRITLTAPNTRVQRFNTRTPSSGNATILPAAAAGDMSVWEPQVVAAGLPTLPRTFRLMFQSSRAGRVGVSHFSVLLVKDAEPLSANATLRARPSNVDTKALVPVDPALSPLRAAHAAAAGSALTLGNDTTHGRKLMKISGGASFARGLKTNFPKFLKRLNDGLENANTLFGAYMDVMGDMMGGTQCYRQSYGRGAGTIPTTCSSDREFSAGLCYERCRGGFYPVNFVCWEHCPCCGWQDHGVTCHQPMHSYWNSNNGCGWWDVCATWDRTWCRSCDGGYRRDGCVCTRDPRWHTKQTYVRNSVVPGCGNKQWQNALCYDSCATGYWGEGPLCYNNCPDAFPHSCGIGLCTASAKVCGEFVTQAVLVVLTFVANLAQTIASGGAGVAGTLLSAADVVMHFADTKTCENHGIHLPSNQWVVDVPNRDFRGTDLAAFHHATWDSCLIACRNNARCEFVVFVPAWTNWCGLKTDLGEGPHGSNSHLPAAGARTGIVFKRLPQSRALFMWADSPAGHVHGGLILPTSQNAQQWALKHGSSGAPNLMVCQLGCLQDKACTHFVYNNENCWLLNRKAAVGSWNFNVAFGQNVWEQSLSRWIGGPTNTMVNMLRWTDFDAA